MDESLFFASHILELSHYCPICVTVIAFTASHQRSLSSSERQRALFIDRHGCHLAAALPVYLNLLICRLASICYSEILLPCQYSCRDGRKRIRVTNVMEKLENLIWKQTQLFNCVIPVLLHCSLASNMNTRFRFLITSSFPFRYFLSKFVYLKL